jgi:hypothetical protein
MDTQELQATVERLIFAREAAKEGTPERHAATVALDKILQQHPGAEDIAIDIISNFGDEA